uniref:uncharacterized protein LOC114671422 n=1 Tax=Macaca mulatta TaxID=9544 RepID=UPI00076009E1|nr:uncharacterized protein LOC114671422 [Macaca mulatta]
MCEEHDNGCKHPGLTLPEEKGKTEPECPLKVKKCPHFYVQIVDLWNLHSTFDTVCDS